MFFFGHKKHRNTDKLVSSNAFDHAVDATNINITPSLPKRIIKKIRKKISRFRNLHDNSVEKNIEESAAAAIITGKKFYNENIKNIQQPEPIKTCYYFYNEKERSTCKFETLQELIKYSDRGDMRLNARYRKIKQKPETENRLINENGTLMMRYRHGKTCIEIEIPKHENGPKKRFSVNVNQQQEKQNPESGIVHPDSLEEIHMKDLIMPVVCYPDFFYQITEGEEKKRHIAANDHWKKIQANIKKNYNYGITKKIKKSRKKKLEPRKKRRIYKQKISEFKNSTPSLQEIAEKTFKPDFLASKCFDQIAKWNARETFLGLQNINFASQTRNLKAEISRNCKLRLENTYNEIANYFSGKKKFFSRKPLFNLPKEEKEIANNFLDFVFVASDAENIIKILEMDPKTLSKIFCNTQNIDNHRERLFLEALFPSFQNIIKNEIENSIEKSIRFHFEKHEKPYSILNKCQKLEKKEYNSGSKEELNTKTLIHDFHLFLYQIEKNTSCDDESNKKTEKHPILQSINTQINYVLNDLQSLQKNKSELSKIKNSADFFHQFIEKHRSVFDNILDLGAYQQTNSHLKKFSMKQIFEKQGLTRKEIDSIVFLTHYFFREYFQIFFQTTKIFKDKFNPDKHLVAIGHQSFINKNYPNEAAGIYEQLCGITTNQQNNTTTITDIVSFGFQSNNPKIESQKSVVSVVAKNPDMIKIIQKNPAIFDWDQISDTQMSGANPVENEIIMMQKSFHKLINTKPPDIQTIPDINQNNTDEELPLFLQAKDKT